MAQLVEYLERQYTRASLQQFLFEHGLDERFSGSSKLSALGSVFHPIATTEDEEEVRKAWEALQEITTALYRNRHRNQREHESYDAFRCALRADGFDLNKGRVAPYPSPSVNVAQEEGVLEKRLREKGFDVALNHLRQAVDNSARAQWEAANASIGSFLESLCEEIAAKLYTDPGSPPTGGGARQYLAAHAFIDRNEADLLRCFFQVLHSSGGRHAGTSSEDDSHRRRLIAVALANYYLERLRETASRTIACG
ncbi:MAG: hypothetical protein HY686_07320 [Chloroflexi bacterium]|nr:hypothetical protein [Chloroflexota bacterium]